MADTLADRILAYLGTLTVTQGARYGEPFKVLNWQRRFVKGAFAPGVQVACLSVARGNGKTSLVSGLAAAAVYGPLQQPRGDTIVASVTFDQARTCYEGTLAFLEPWMDDLRDWRIANSTNAARVEHKASRARLRCVSHEGRVLHGSQPSLIIMDEPSKFREKEGDALYAAALTSLGKLANARVLILGTRPDDSDHFFQKLLDGGADYSQCHAAAKDDPPHRKRTWTKSNPSMSHLPDLENAIRSESGKAKADPSHMQPFRALRLNQGVGEALRRELVSAEVWAGLEGEAEATGPYILGCDVGDVGSMSAVAGFWIDTGRLEALASFPRVPDMAERGRKDHVGMRYVRMVEDHDLITTGFRVVDLSELLTEAVRRWGWPCAVVCDHFHLSHLQDAMDAVGFGAEPVVRRGLDAAVQDMRDFRAAVMDQRIVPKPQRILRSAMAEATIATVANAKDRLAKGAEAGRRSRGKDDVVSAALVAVAFGMRAQAEPEPAGEFFGEALYS